MQHFNWDPDKNERLQWERGDEVDIVDDPNQERYAGQKVSVVIGLDGRTP